MKTKIFTGLGLAGLFCLAMTGCNSAERVEAIDVNPPVIKGMKSEFVPAGKEAVIYGENFRDAKVEFDTQFYGEMVEAEIVEDKSNDSVLVVIVPRSAWSGKIKVSALGGETYSPFLFRDKRNLIMDFDLHHQTWGGYSSTDPATNELAKELVAGEKLAAPLPEPCSGKYSVLYGEYCNSWSFDNNMWLQYMGNFDEGGRGNVSVAGLHFLGMPIENLVLKFECNIPKEAPYKGVRTEIFSGPYNAPNKHGRERSVICFWEPWTGQGYSVAGNNEGKDLSNGFYTDGWETITIPLTEFKHNSTTDEIVHDLRMDLFTSINFSFLQMGSVDEKNPANVYMCVDNFRIVPAIEE